LITARTTTTTPEGPKVQPNWLELANAKSRKGTVDTDIATRIAAAISDTTSRIIEEPHGPTVPSVACAMMPVEKSTDESGPAFVAGDTGVPQLARQVMELTPPVAGLQLKIVPRTV
jgi:hypothetical protein